MNNKPIKELYFDEPLLKMGVGARFLVRFAAYSFYGLMVASTVALLLSDIDWLNGTGLFFLIFLADRLIYARDAEENFSTPPRGRVNIARYISPASLYILEYSAGRAKHFLRNPYLFLLQRLVARSDIKEVLNRIDVNPAELLDKVEEYISKDETDKVLVEGDCASIVHERIESLATKAFYVAERLNSFDIEPKDLFAALGRVDDKEVQTIFEIFGISSADLETAVIFSKTAGYFKKFMRTPGTITEIAHGPYFVRHRTMNRAWTAKPTPTLDQFGLDLTDLARGEKVGFLVGHTDEFERMIDVLSRPSNPSALLVGPPGIGKEAIVAHLAFQLAKDKVPEALFDKRLVELRLGALVAGADPAELRRRVQAIVGEVAATKNVILYIPEIHNLVKTGGGDIFGAADILIPAILNGAFSVVGATYPREFKEHVEPRSDFLGAFDVIRIQEISEDEAVKFLVYESMILERQHNVMISFGAIKKAASIANKYLNATPLPGSAQSLLKEAIADAIQKEDKILNADHVITIAERRVNVPLHEATEDESYKLLNLESEIHKNLVDQEEAVKVVSRAMREYRAGLSRKGGPIASFLFVGPTGVGKTELSKILAKIQYGKKEAMLRFDMSEFQSKESVARLIGLDNGVISGTLTDSVLEKPFSLILLDEFEKAHPDILNIFLQVFDDGRLTDSLGRTVDFQNTIIIATSNAHSDFIKASLEAGTPMPEISEELKKKLTSYFRPELLNRFSGIIVFKTLSPDDILKIAALQLKDVSETVKESQGIEIEFTESAIAEVARLGYDQVFGARPLRAVISDRIKSVLAEKILKGEMKKMERVSISFKDGEFVFEKT